MDRRVNNKAILLALEVRKDVLYKASLQHATSIRYFKRALGGSTHPKICATPSLAVRKTTPTMVLTEEQKRSFIRDGYLVLRNVATREMAKDALRVVDKARAKGAFTEEDALPDVKREAERAPEIYRMMTDTILPEACEDLIGKGKIKYGKNAQIAIRPTEEKFKEKGMTMTENMPKHKWHIDGGKGKYRKTASPFTLLVGVALSEGQDIEENRGQLNVWPGTYGEFSLENAHSVEGC